MCGGRRLWEAARRVGIDVGGDQTAKLMKNLGIRGVLRSKRVKTTTDDSRAARHPDLAKRAFTADAPHQFWVTDLTFVPTRAGVAYVGFIIDVFSRMIVGWRAASHTGKETVLDAIEMARWSRGQQLPGSRCRNDASALFTSIRYGEGWAGIGAVPSIGTVGDSYDNALTETVNGYNKPELVGSQPEGAVENH